MSAPVEYAEARAADHAVGELRVAALGRLDLRCGEEPVLMPTSGRARSLLAFLALHAGQPQSRQRIAGLLWPESTEGQARTNLRNVLHLLRRSVPGIERHLEATPGALCWRSGPGMVDALAFGAAVERARALEAGSAEQVVALREAVAGYGGDLLPECDDEWAVQARVQFAELFAEALRSLATVLLDRGETAEALRLGRELVRREPLNEEYHRLLVEAHQRAGDRAGALRAYHECAAVLDRELGVEPAPETRRLYAAVVRTAQAPDGPVAGPVLVGRDAERAALGRCWRAALSAGPHLAVVTGEPGVGKTRLADELATWCAHRGFVVGRARSYADEGDLGYGVVVSWLRSPGIAAGLRDLPVADRRVLARLLPELGDAATDAERRRLFEAVAHALAGAGRPLLLVADDAHWADDPSVELIHYLVRAADARQLLLVATVRWEELDEQHPMSAVVDALQALGRATQVPLGRLGRQDTADLARRLLGCELTDADAQALYVETEGNPLFVVETIRSGWDAAGSRPLAPKLQAVTRARLGRLSPPARELLAAVSCIGRSFTAGLAARVTGTQEAALVQGLDELWRRGVLREHGTDAYDFSHGKIREVAYDAVRPAARRHLHLRIAEALAAHAGADPDDVSGEIAAQYERAGRPLDAIRWYQRAAQRAQHRFADPEAVRLLHRARRLVPALSAHVAPTVELEILSRSPIVVGTVNGYESDELIEILDRAVELASVLGVELTAPILRCLVMTRLCRDDFAGARAAAAALADAARGSGDESLMLEAQYLGGVAAFWHGDFTAARDLLERVGRGFPVALRADHLVRFGHDPGIVCLSRLANTLWFLGDTAAARATRRQAQEHADQVGHRYTAAVVGVFSSLLALDLGDDDEFRRRSAEFAAAADHGFNVVVKSHALLGYVAALDGHGRQGIASARKAIETSRGRNLAPGFRATLYRILVATHHRAADPAGGLAAADEALALPGTRIWEPQVRRLRAESLAILGRPLDEVDAELRRAAGAATSLAAPGPLRLVEQARVRLLR